MLSLILDLILIVLAVMTVVHCASRGFVKSVVHLVSIIAACVAARIFTPEAALWLEEKFFNEAVTEKVADTIRSVAIRTGENMDFTRLFADMPTDFARLLERFNADADALNAAFGGLSEAGAEMADRMAYSIAEPVVHGLANVCAFVGIFIVAIFACSLLGGLLGLIVRLPVLRTADRLLGFVLGVICAAALAWGFAQAAELAVGYVAAVDPTAVDSDAIAKTMLLRHLCAVKFW